MSNTIAILIRNVPDDLRLVHEIKINGVDVKSSALAFYDIFENNEKLEEFVRRIASGIFDDAENEAREIMEQLKFA